MSPWQSRDAVIGLFSGDRDKVQKKDVTNAIEAATGGGINDALYAQIMKEVATSKNSFWHLKNGQLE